jgi:hypothetical protein
MKRRPRIHYTDSQKALMWERWKEGWSLQQIAQLFDRPHTSVQGMIARAGGIRPPERHRSRLALSWPSAKRSLERWQLATRSDPSPAADRTFAV